MEENTGQLYWFRRPKGEKDLLVFWAGDPLGSIYSYKFKEELPAIKLGDLMREHDRECWIWKLGDKNVIYSAGEWDLLQKLT